MHTDLQEREPLDIIAWWPESAKIEVRSEWINWDNLDEQSGGWPVWWAGAGRMFTERHTHNMIIICQTF